MDIEFLVFCVIILIVGFWVYFLIYFPIWTLGASAVIAAIFIYPKVQERRRLAREKREAAQREQDWLSRTEQQAADWRASEKESLVRENERLARMEREAAQHEQARHEALAKEAEGCLRYFRDTILVSCLVIDSNIWMNEDYDSFFHILRRSTAEASTQVVLFSPQFDEICNIKKTSGYEDAKNKRARIAINRIEAFQKDDLLRIESVTIDADRSAYADPIIIKLLIAEAKASKTLVFVSDDKELRIRVREHLRSVAPNRFTIIEIEPLLDCCAKVIEAETLQIIPQVA